MLTRVLFCRANSIVSDPRVLKEARSLAQAGYSVSLLGWDMSASLPEFEALDGIPCYRIKVKAQFGRGIRNITHQLRWQVALFNWLRCHHNEFGILHACDFDTIIPALLAGRLWDKRVIYDIFDFYADMLRLTPRWVVNAIRALDLLAISWSSGVILADESRFEQIAGSHPRRTTVINNCAEDWLGHLTPIPREKKIGVTLRLAYVGNLQIQRGLLILLKVLSDHPEWELELAGSGPDEEQIIHAAGSLPNVHWHGLVSYEKGLQFAHSADSLIATYDPGLTNHRYSSANKIFEAMMLAKPIVVARGTNMDRLIETQKAGLVVEYGNPNALDKALCSLENEEFRRRLGMNARRAYEEFYNWHIMQARLLKFYQEVLSGDGQS